MLKQNKSADKKKPQNTMIGGFNVYHDDKNRTIYYNRFTKRAFIIKPNDFNTFQTYNMRYFLGLAVMIVLFSFSDTYLANPVIAIGVGVLVFAVLQFKFNNFLKRCTNIANFDPKNAYGHIQILSVEESKRIILKAVLFIALAVLVVYNSYVQQYNMLSMVITWLLAVYAVIEVIILLMALNYKRSHPDLDLSFIKENHPK